MITLETIKKNPEIRALIDAANEYLRSLGYTEHGKRHVGYVSAVAASTLRDLFYTEHEIEIAAIAGWVHDVGNCVNRNNHGPTGAMLLYPILRDIGADIDDVLSIITAVGNHEEHSGHISSAISAALVIGDKSDAHRTRVRSGGYNPSDIHDRVNFSIIQNRVRADADARVIVHELEMDSSSSVMEFLQIYMPRVIMCELAAAHLGCAFELAVNGAPVNNRPKSA